MADSQRLDIAMVARAMCESRQKAQAIILSGQVYLGEQRADKPSIMVNETVSIHIRGAAHPYKSRGGLKLEKALDAFSVNPEGKTCIDVGASTGGFTDVLLQRGALSVYAVDVGYGQLDYALRIDPRVRVMERTNARTLMPSQFEPLPTLAVMDVSFISIRLILPALFTLIGDEGHIVTLVKPQFEAGRQSVGKKGVVRDAAVHLRVLSNLCDFIQQSAWTATAVTFSPITGPEGNIEFFLHAQKTGNALTASDLQDIVEAAHALLKT